MSETATLDHKEQMEAEGVPPEDGSFSFFLTSYCDYDNYNTKYMNHKNSSYGNYNNSVREEAL